MRVLWGRHYFGKRGGIRKSVEEGRLTDSVPVSRIRFHVCLLWAALEALLVEKVGT